MALLCTWYWFDPCGSFWPFLVCLFFHEGGHLLALWALRVPVQHLRLTVFGAEIETTPLPFLKDAVAAAAGPLMNLLLCYATAVRLPVMALISLGLLAFNLLPFYPLDGGRISRALLHLLCSDRVAALLEHLITGLGLTLLLAFSVYLTFFWNAGSWPVLLFGMIFGKICLARQSERKFLHLRS